MANPNNNIQKDQNQNRGQQQGGQQQKQQREGGMDTPSTGSNQRSTGSQQGKRDQNFDVNE